MSAWDRPDDADRPQIRDVAKLRSAHLAVLWIRDASVLAFVRQRLRRARYRQREAADQQTAANLLGREDVSLLIVDSGACTDNDVESALLLSRGGVGPMPPVVVVDTGEGPGRRFDPSIATFEIRAPLSAGTFDATVAAAQLLGPAEDPSSGDAPDTERMRTLPDPAEWPGQRAADDALPSEGPRPSSPAVSLVTTQTFRPRSTPTVPSAEVLELRRELRRQTRSTARVQAEGITSTMPVPKVSSSASWLPTAMVGPYMLVAVLGRGGAATVYHARHTEDWRDVALKVLDRGRTLQQGVERFEQEMAICAQLDHPNVVRTFEAGAHGEHLYLVMELLHGQDLASVLEEAGGPLPVLQVLDWALQVCDGLEYAHAAEVIHRDIKPHNIFVCTDGTIKIMDFGIARRLTESLTLTGDKGILGTPAYLPPERFRNNRLINERTDIYSLGASLYHLLTDTVPFDMSDVASLMGSIIFGDIPPPSTHNPAIRPRLDALVLTAMARDNGARFEDCAALRRALQAARQEAATT